MPNAKQAQTGSIIHTIFGPNKTTHHCVTAKRGMICPGPHIFSSHYCYSQLTVNSKPLYSGKKKKKINKIQLLKHLLSNNYMTFHLMTAVKHGFISGIMMAPCYISCSQLTTPMLIP